MHANYLKAPKWTLSLPAKIDGAWVTVQQQREWQGKLRQAKITLGLAVYSKAVAEKHAARIKAVTQVPIEVGEVVAELELLS